MTHDMYQTNILLKFLDFYLIYALIRKRWEMLCLPYASVKKYIFIRKMAFEVFAYLIIFYVLVHYFLFRALFNTFWQGHLWRANFKRHFDL